MRFVCDLQFCHLHGHTKFSIGDSTTDPYQIAKKALENGMKAFAITDHGIASSWIQAAKAAKQVTEEARAKEIKRREELGLPIDEKEINQIGVKFIPGIEIYETEDRLIKSKNEMKEKGYGHYHLLLLPKNNEGLVNLNKIISDASLNGLFDRRNRTDLRVIKENGWGKHIIATSACLASRLSKTILSGDYEKAKQLALEYASIFEEFYLELQDNGIKDQYIVNDALIRISQETGLPLVFTKDYHYLNADEQDAHDTWICIGRKLDKKEKDRLRYEGYPYHFATKEEMYESVKKGIIPQEAYENTVKIAEKCNVDFDFKKNRFPKYKFIPKGHTADTYLRTITFHRLLQYAIEQKELNTPIVLEEYMKRLDYELKVISDKGYSDYFLILHDIFSYCKKSKIPYGPGRGSGAGSLVAFLCDITGVDPIRHGLLFERFLNPERMSMPDIDFDICSERRPELFRYVYHHFGEKHVAQIITYGGEKLRSAIDDLCRVLKETDEAGNVIKYGQKLADEIKKTIPMKFPDQTDPTYAKMKALAENPEDFRRDFREKTDDLHKKAVKFMEYMKQYPDIDYYLRYVENLIRSYGQHAAAVVITSEEITEHIPVYNMKKEMPVTAFAMKEIDEDLNMLKLDALSLATMTIIQKALDLINKGKPEHEHLVLSKLSLDDKETIRTIRQGHTVGVFQLSGNAITQYIKRVKPWDFDTIVDISALNWQNGAVKAGYMLGSPKACGTLIA